MLRVTCAAALIWMTLFSSCSGGRTLDDAELKSAATEIVSIAAEGELLATAAAEYRAPDKYAAMHPEYLRKEAEEVAQQLSRGRPNPGAEYQFNRLHRAAMRLLQTLDALPAGAGDPRWQQARLQFGNVRRESEEIRRTF
jgi:hypothetical protein